ncbi:MAG: hypothetical protein CL916_05765 [Deltaproteobacteria bacterium]|nr:hypothetical protein [Deltaproteobacteria bacterium]
MKVTRWRQKMGNQLCIKGLNKDQKDRTYTGHDPLIVGRSRSCDIFIADVRSSRQQARFFWNEREQLFVEDLGSLNGSFVNGVQIERTRLHEGDIVRLGSTDFKVQRVDNKEVQVVESIFPQKTTMVKQMAQLSMPSLETMHVHDYFEAIGVTEKLQNEMPQEQHELHRQTRNFATLFEISKAMHREDDISSMLDGVLDLLIKVPGGDLAYVVMLDEREVLQTKAVRNKRGETNQKVSISSTLANYVLNEQCGVIAPDLQNDERFNSSQSILMSLTASVLAAPIIIEEQSRGILAILAEDSDPDVQEADLELLCIVAGLLARTIQNLELQGQREQYLRELESANRKILETQEQLLKSEKMAAIGRLSSGVIHEVKNHLSPLMLADFVAEQYPEDEDIQEMTEMVIEARRRILDLVDEIRMFARGDTRQYNMLAHELKEVVEKVIRFVSCDAKVRRARLTYTCDDNPQLIMDTDRLRQVLINLIQNAADAVEDSLEPTINVRTYTNAGYACIAVKDNGIGIPKELIRRVFDPLFTTKGENGLGLGLDICRRIVKAHKGELLCSSVEGEGTMFTIMIPLNPTELDMGTTL